MITAQSFLAAQLRAAVPSADWDAKGVDRALELGGILAREGVTSLSDLIVQPIRYFQQSMRGECQPQGESWSPPDHCYGPDAWEFIPIDSFRFLIKGRPVGFMGTPGRHDTQTEHFELSTYGWMVAWSAVGDGQVGYYIVPRGRGGFALIPKWSSSSDLTTIKEFLLAAAPLALVFLPIAGVQVAQALGGAIMGPTAAAAYPAAANAIGQVAIGTALSGGDIEGAVKNAVLSYGGNFAGALAGSTMSGLTGLDIIGKVASAATSAAVTGGSVENAIIGVAIQTGVQTVNNWDFEAISPIEFVFDPLPTNPNDWGFNEVPDVNLSPFDPLPGFNWPVINDGTPPGLEPLPDWEFTPGVPLDPTWELPPVDYSPPAFEVPIPTVPGFTGPAPAPVGSGGGNWLQTITAAAMAAIQINAAYRASQNPQVVNQPRGVLPNGATQQVNPNGTISTRQPSGQVTTTRPPVGTPYTAADGSIIINNGNGTYDRITPAGQRQTLPYAGAASGGGFDMGGSIAGIPTPLLIGGAALAAILLINR